MPLSGVAGALRPLLPELAEVLPAAPDPLDDRVAERHRVFRGLTDVLVAACPAVLVLEDLHWAEEQTADFLAYLLGDPPPGLTVVLTYRGEEVSATVRASTIRLPPGTSQAHLVLAPLDQGETGAMATAILDTDRVSEEFARYLWERTSGLPFAVEEVLALVRERGSLVRRGDRWTRRVLEQLEVPRGSGTPRWNGSPGCRSAPSGWPRPRPCCRPRSRCRCCCPSPRTRAGSRGWRRPSAPGC
ncbi:hypothetical protein ACFQYP_40860 [Nonomuraea antimicrobica]